MLEEAKLMTDNRNKTPRRNLWLWIGITIAIIFIVGIKVGLRTEPVNVPPGQHTQQ